MRLKEDMKIILLMSGIALMIVFAFAQAYKGAGVPSVAIVDNDQSAYSAKLIEEIKGFKQYSYEIMDEATATEDVRDENVAAAVVIDEGFEESILNGTTVELKIIKATDSLVLTNLNATLNGLVSKFAGNVEAAQLAAETVSMYKADADAEQVYDSAYEAMLSGWELRRPIIVKTERVQGQVKSYDSLLHGIIGFTLFFSMYTMVFGIADILEEKEHYTWQRQLVSPISKFDMITGNMIMTFFTGSFNVALIFIGGKFLFGMEWAGSILTIMVIVAAFVFCVTSMGLFMSTFIKTHAQLSALTPVVLTATAMLGGCFWPLEIVNSKIMLFVAKLTPQMWALQGVERVAMYGFGLNDVLMNVAVLTGMGIVYLTLGVKFMKNEI